MSRNHPKRHMFSTKVEQKQRASRYERLMAAQRRYTQKLHAPAPNGPVTTMVAGLDQLPRFGTHQQRLYVLGRDGYQCRYCGFPLTIDTANLDHVQPFKHGGETLVSNLVACCPECNKSKGNRLWKPKARETVAP